MSANPLVDAPTVLVTAVGRAEGSRAAAAALACSGADVDRAALLVDMGGRAPRPTLLASAAAHRLEERLAAHLPQARIAARGQVCHLALAADLEGLEMASAAVSTARGSLAVVHLPPALLQSALNSGPGPRASAVLLRADLDLDRALTALVVRDLIVRGLSVAILKQHLSWVAERRALFGALTPGGAGGLPPQLLKRLLSHACYAGADDAATDPTRAAKRERRDHAGTRSR